MLAATRPRSLTVCAALEARGLVNRAGYNRPARPITVSTLHRLLAHPYYVGIVVYKGAFYEGSHPSLIPRELWLRVQDVLAAHNSAGEKDRRHPHYLKGTIYCGECGNRLVFTRNKGKLGAYYDYFFCLGRRAKAAPCTRKYVSVEAVEKGVEDFYLRLHFTPKRIEEIRQVVREELANGQADARFTLGEARRRHATLKNEQAALMKAHYAGAVPLDILKSEMERITREADAAEHQIAASEQALEQLDDQLERALEVARLCHEKYVNAVPAERRLLNQGLFTKLFIAQDGSVEDAEVQDLLAGLLSKDSTLAVEAREIAVVPVPTQQDATQSATGTDGALVPVREWANRPERRWSPSAVLLRMQTADSGEYAQTPPKLSFGRGSNKAHLAEGVGFEPTGHCCPLVFKTRSIGRSDNPPERTESTEPRTRRDTAMDGSPRANSRPGAAAEAQPSGPYAAGVVRAWVACSKP